MVWKATAPVCSGILSLLPLCPEAIYEAQRAVRAPLLGPAGLSWDQWVRGTGSMRLQSLLLHCVAPISIRVRYQNQRFLRPTSCPHYHTPLEACPWVGSVKAGEYPVPYS